MKVILLCNRYLSDFDYAVINSVLTSNKIQIVGAIVNSRSRGSLLARLKKELKKGRGGFVLIQAIRTLRKKVKGKSQIKIEDLLGEKKIMVTSSLYREEVYHWIREKGGDCMLLRGFGIIREPILSFCPYGVISYHHGDLLKYRGGPPAFWELYNDEKEIGVTIQILDRGIDTGTIVLQRFFPIGGTETWSGLTQRIYDGSIDLARDALQKLSGSGPMKNPVGEKGKLYTLPNFTQWLGLQTKILKRKLLR